ncbi:MAG: S-adenosylmethionine:tRNA ribosyltransferase-isomerase [Gaiellaceae bacterium]
MRAALAFELPERLEAHEPPEARGLARDEVRMLVASRATGELADAAFRDLPEVLAPGDVVVVNTSATLPASLPAERPDGSAIRLNLSTPVPGTTNHWVVELRCGDAPCRSTEPETLALPDGARARLLAPYLAGRRLWVARLELLEPLSAYLAEHGAPIRYRYVPSRLPLERYQTVFAREPGSAEMPSAARPFTHEIVTALVARGIAIAPLVLHTGVSSLEEGEAPYPERYCVPEATARMVTSARRSRGRVIAVGTTAVRALETVARPDGRVVAGEGWTDLVISPERPPRVVDGLLTGWHEPGASHLHLLDAVAGRALVARSYDAALARGYLWHEFGDVHLITP